MNIAEARILERRYQPAGIELRPCELTDLDRLSADEVTALLQRRFRRFLESGCDHTRALMLAVGLS